jgi:hypothetical protein
MIELDTSRMELCSICVENDNFTFGPHFIASPISQYLVCPSPTKGHSSQSYGQAIRIAKGSGLA